MENGQFSLGGLLQRVRDSVSGLPGLGLVSIQCLVDPSLPDILVGDALCVQEVIAGLLAAACRSSGAPQIQLSVFPARERQTELELTFEMTPGPVSGSRPGAPLSNNPGDWDAARASVASLRRPIELMGADAGVQAESNGVPVVWFRIPLQAAAVSSGAAHGERSGPQPYLKAAQAAKVAQVARFPLRILMAEDNSINQRVGKLILQRAGYQIDLVGDGSEALEAHRKGPYDLILMDCQMPTMDGLEATRHIRSAGSRQPVIIAVTANALTGERERCLAAGMDDYLSKPFQAEQLISIIEKWAEAALCRPPA